MYKTLKEQAFEANMALAESGLVVLTWGNVSAVDRKAGVMAIKPSGVPYKRLKAEDMVVVALEDGAVVSGALRPSSDAPTHRVLYRAWEGIGGITHTHSRYATAWAQAGRSIPCLGTTHADSFYGEVPCTRALTAREVEEAYEENTGLVILESFADRAPAATPAALVRQHGPFAWGSSAMDSVHNAVILEEVAAMALHTLALTPDAPPTPKYLLEKHYGRKHGVHAYYGQHK